MTETMAVGVLEFLMENRAAGEDGGPSIRVCSVVEGCQVELLRFDMFFKEPHYHYDPAGADLRYHLDPLTHVDTIGWVIDQFRERLPEMVARAGQPALSKTINVTEVGDALPEMERRWRALI
jgi:hypothetical protein